ncbi:MAG: ABC transporter ATP-binding protein, partial [Bradyrhizobiaceae bacterium]|nr:ABC transporter ATP-binding protein [Bradyrhizobiaceae bacterium]
MLANSALRLADVDAFYGDSHVLQKVSFELGEGRLLGLLGRNGAGKSTCMNVSVGLLPPRAGSVEVFGAPVTRLPPEMIAMRGVALVPQGRRVFKSLTVRENLIVAARGLIPGTRHAPWTEDTVFAMFPRLEERRTQFAGYLSGGEQQMLAIGRALMGRPRLLLLDEPSLGLAPLIVRKIFDIIREINAEGTTIFLVEQNAHLALKIAHRAYVLQTGQIIMSDSA